MRVLITEDDSISRRIIQLFLEPYGECVTTADGEEAYRAYLKAFDEGKPFDLVLLDVVMPKREGTEVLKMIREHETQKGIEGDKTTKVIMLTGQADATKINDAMSLGAAYYLLKPIEEQKLIRELQRLGLIEDADDAW